MPFDNEKYHAKAEQSQVGAVALDISIALSQVTRALSKIAKASGADVSKEIAEIQRMNESLDERFDNLTGWTPSEP